MSVKPFSLRRQITLVTVSACLVTTLLAALIVDLVVRQMMLREFDKVQVAKARSVASLMDFEGSGIEWEGQVPPEYAVGKSPQYFQLWRGANALLMRSPSLQESDLTKLTGIRRNAVSFDVTLPDGRRGRQVQLSFHPGDRWTHPSNRDDDDGRSWWTDDDDDDDDDDEECDDDENEQDEIENDGEFAEVISPFAGSSGVPQSAEPITLALASGTDPLFRTLARLRLTLLLVASLASVACAAFLTNYIPRGLRPLAQLTHSIEGVGAGDLSQRVELNRTPDELSPVVEKFNNLLERLDSAFQRERAFTSNVAHELRTPIAGIRSNLQLALSKRRSPEEYQRLIGVSLGICDEMRHAVESLLSLARLDAGHVVMKRETICVAELLREAWKVVEPIARDRDISVAWDLDERLIAEADRDNLRLALRNLLQNAASYSAGTIQVRSRRNGMEASVSVSNPVTNGQIPSTDNVFVRYWRGSPEAPQQSGHVGLGLPICKMIVEAMNGQISAHRENGHFRIDVTIPMSD